jgi:hypothetical protein
MKPSRILSALFFTSVLATPTFTPSDPLVERQLISGNPTTDLSEVVKLATALNKLLTGDNINHINNLINKLDLLLDAANLVNLDVIFDGGALLLAKDVVTQIIFLIQNLVGLLNGNLIGQIQKVLPALQTVIPQLQAVLQLLTTFLDPNLLKGLLNTLPLVSSALDPAFIKQLQTIIPQLQALLHQLTTFLDPNLLKSLLNTLPLVSSALDPAFIKQIQSLIPLLTSTLDPNLVKQFSTLLPLLATSLDPTFIQNLQSMVPLVSSFLNPSFVGSTQSVMPQLQALLTPTFVNQSQVMVPLVNKVSLKPPAGGTCIETQNANVKM